MAVTKRETDGISWTHVAIEVDPERYLEDFRTHLLSHVRPDWSPQGTRAKVFVDGFTNKLVALYHEGGPKDDLVLMRINGRGTETFIDRDSELISTQTLHRAGLAAPVYLQFDNGTCYGYLPGRTVRVEEMGDRAMLRRVAKMMAQLHATRPPAVHPSGLPFVWAKCDDWISKVPQTFEDSKKNETFQRVIGSPDTLRTEYQWLRGVLKGCRSPLVFCHNDIHCGNLIYNEDTGIVRFIDLEYADVNHSAYDIGNYFCEFAGFVNPQYCRYPDEQTQNFFIRSYLEESKIIRGESHSSVSDEDVKAMHTEANRFALASHMLWALWAYFQALYSTKNFDYVEYAGMRFAEFLKRKEEFCAL